MCIRSFTGYLNSPCEPEFSVQLRYFVIDFRCRKVAMNDIVFGNEVSTCF